MKILLVHNYYRSGIPSGENTVFEAEAHLLEQAGHEVERFTRSNDEIEHAPLRTALSATLLGAHNPFSVAALRDRLGGRRPDVVHIHNTFPLLSPSVLGAARAHGSAVVATLHNYRVACLQNGLFRDGHICLECIEQRRPWPGVRHGCYRGSRLASLPVAGTIAWHQRRGTWSRDADLLIALTGFQKDMLQRAGLPPERVQVKPNFTAAAPSLPWSEREDCALYLGRISPEKGVLTLLDAWERLGAAAPRLKIVGAGELLAELRKRVAQRGLGGRIELLGALPHGEAMAQLARARLLIYPSAWYEPFGMSIIEAYARAVPVLASRLGSLPDLVRDDATGGLFAAGDAAALAGRVQALWRDPARLAAMGAAGHAYWEQQFSPAVNLARLEAIYREAVQRRVAAPL